MAEKYNWHLFSYRINFIISSYVCSNFIDPPIPSVKAIGIVGKAEWLRILLGYWINKNRDPQLAA